MPVLFTPRGFMTLLLSIRAGLNGKTVYQGASPLAEKMGLKAFDSRLSIYDDATFDWAVSSLPIDGEGVPTQRTPLIEEPVAPAMDSGRRAPGTTSKALQLLQLQI